MESILYGIVIGIVGILLTLPSKEKTEDEEIEYEIKKYGNKKPAKAIKHNGRIYKHLEDAALDGERVGSDVYRNDEIGHEINIDYTASRSGKKEFTDDEMHTCTIYKMIDGEYKEIA